MITAKGYSKDPSIMPEGIAVTFGKEMMQEQGGVKQFLWYFNDVMADPSCHWLHKMKNKPTMEFDHVYIIVLNRLFGRAFFGGFEKKESVVYTADGGSKVIDWPRMILAGPIERCPFKRELKGFQGFRYTTKLF